VGAAARWGGFWLQCLPRVVRHPKGWWILAFGYLQGVKYDYCLIRTFEEARNALEAGKFDDSEPGPFRVSAVYRLGWCCQFE
jgi:hypothetical protein